MHTIAALALLVAVASAVELSVFHEIDVLNLTARAPDPAHLTGQILLKFVWIGDWDPKDDGLRSRRSKDYYHQFVTHTRKSGDVGKWWERVEQAVSGSVTFSHSADADNDNDFEEIVSLQDAATDTDTTSIQGVVLDIIIRRDRWRKTNKQIIVAFTDPDVAVKDACTGADKCSSYGFVTYNGVNYPYIWVHHPGNDENSDCNNACTPTDLELPFTNTLGKSARIPYGKPGPDKAVDRASYAVLHQFARRLADSVGNPFGSGFSDGLGSLCAGEGFGTTKLAGKANKGTQYSYNAKTENNFYLLPSVSDGSACGFGF